VHAKQQELLPLFVVAVVGVQYLHQKALQFQVSHKPPTHNSISMNND
jgi:hypothetical protein